MKTLLIFCIFLATFPLFSQHNQANIWYFGNGNGINFNTNPPKTLNNGVFSEGRINTICDNQGELLFYTDGISVINKNHKIMKNGYDLLGHADVVIIPFPNNKNLFHIFSISIYDKIKSNFSKIHLSNDTIKNKSLTDVEAQNNMLSGYKLAEKYNQKNANLYHHIIDISKNNGLGEVVEKNKFLYQKIKADLVVARHANNKDYWLITHEFMTNKFKVFLINEKGLQEKPIETEIGMKIYDEGNFTTLSSNNNAKNHNMVISNDFQKISIYDKLQNKVQVFDFDNIDGKVLNTFSIDMDLRCDLMSMCFSPLVNKLYIMHRNMGFNSNEPFIYLTQYNLNIKNNEDFLRKKQRKKYYLTKKDRVEMEGDLQVTPNGKIYFMRWSKGVGTIENPNDDLDSLRFNYNALKYEVNPRFTLPKVAHLLPLFYSPIKSGDTFQREILFETNKYDLKEHHYPILGDIVQFLKENPKTNITISGHTDNEGQAQANKILSENRAKSVKNYLISQKIDKNRITSQGFGDTKPLLDNSTPENKRKNRRIEFLIQ